MLDVDGVLTDGSIMLDDHGVETKRFSVRDGQGIATWLRLGLEIAIITKRSGAALQHRCRELGITRIIQGSKDKLAALEQVIAETGISAAEIAYIGDDWPDLAPMSRVAFPVAPADADERVRAIARLITTRPGGRGAVREAIEHILTVRGLMAAALAPYAPRA